MTQPPEDGLWLSPAEVETVRGYLAEAARLGYVSVPEEADLTDGLRRLLPAPEVA